MNKEHKKRGRKPKSNIIVNNNPIFKNETLNDIIVCINNNNVNKNNNNYLENDIIDDNLVNSCDVSKCKNCSKILNNIKIELPIKYLNGIFTSNQSFCSFECAHRYCYDSVDNYQESLSLLYLYYYKIFNEYSIIDLPRPISILKHNGGNMSIDKYTKNFKNIISNNNYPITLKSDIKINNNKNIFNDKIQNLKLYRINKLSKNKNNIFNKMNLYVTDE